MLEKIERDPAVLIDGDNLAVQERAGRQPFARPGPAVEIEPDAKIRKLTGEFFYSVVGFSAERELSRKKIDELGTGAHVGVDTWKESPWILPVEDERAGEPAWESPWAGGDPVGT